MSDGPNDRMAQLRARWQGDPTSRIFLQLAEEYRHLGRVQEALEVLNAGLQEHPGYLSALVAKGRCLLELGDAAAARPVLERVVQQDPTQMVANKLLVRACLETGEPERARQRLDLYSLLNDRDPEIEELERRVEAMSRPPQATDGPRLEEPAERPPMDPSTSQASHEAAATGDVFDLAPAAAPAGSAAEGPFELSATPEEGSPWIGDPFPDLAPDYSRRVYLAHLEAEQIFRFASPASGLRDDTLIGESLAPFGFAPPATEAPVAETPVAETPVAETPVAETPVAETPVAEAAAEAAAHSAAQSLATLTLGELYLRQGHEADAASIFREVAAREPGNAAARQALDDLDRRNAPPATPTPELPPGARKVLMLQGYLNRLRQPRQSGGHPNVP